MLAIVLESRPHDLYALGGSTEPVVAPQWIFGQAKNPSLSPGGARGAPNTVPAPVPYSRERSVAVDTGSPADGAVGHQAREPEDLQKCASRACLEN